MSDDTTNVGNITARLVLDGDQFEREITQAREQADRLDGREVNVRADADTAHAREQLAALDAAADSSTRHTNAFGESQRGANNALRGFSPPPRSPWQARPRLQPGPQGWPSRSGPWQGPASPQSSASSTRWTPAQ